MAGETETRVPAREGDEPLDTSPVQEGVQSFTVEEMDRLVRIFRLLDAWDRSQAKSSEREAA